MSQIGRAQDLIVKRYKTKAGFLKDGLISYDSTVGSGKKERRQIKIHQKQQSCSGKVLKRASCPQKAIKKSSEGSNQKVEEDHSTGVISHPDNRPDEQFNDSLRDGSLPEGQYSFKDNTKKAYYLAVESDGVVTGFLGHGTLILEEPIIEGNYYFEIQVLPPKTPTLKLEYHSGVRIGLCSHWYNLSHPLGKDSSSVSFNGNIISGSEFIKNDIVIATGDTIGMTIKIGAPHKHRRESQIHKQSEVTFFRNGVKIGQTYRKLKQQIYHIGVSLFNFAKVKVNLNCQGREFEGTFYQSFRKIDSRKLDYYKDFESSIYSRHQK